jgi:crotonobetainyl-CoA:carnitine CoA-transferase CaiB-like acyl-CoA transferase
MMGFALPRQFRARAGNPLWNHYRCADGRWIALGMLQPDRYWRDLCDALGRPELGGDARFADLRARAQNAEACVAELDAIFATRPRDEWSAILRAHRGDFIFTRVNAVDDLPDDPQVRANGYVVEFDHPTFGPTPMLGVPVRLSETPGSVRAPAPEFGQHSETILNELLGYDWEEITELRKREVL